MLFWSYLFDLNNNHWTKVYFLYFVPKHVFFKDLWFRFSIKRCQDNAGSDQRLTAKHHSSSPGVLTLDRDLHFVDGQIGFGVGEGVVDAVVGECLCLVPFSQCHWCTTLLFPLAADSCARFKVRWLNPFTSCHCIHEVVHELESCSFDGSSRWVSCSTLLEIGLIARFQIIIQIFWL